MTDTHDGVKLKAGLYQHENGSITLCILDLMRSKEFKGKPADALGQLWRWAREALDKGYKYAGILEPWHLVFSAPKKEGAK